MILLVLLIAGLVLLALAGFNIKGDRFAPEWLALLCLAIVFFHHSLPIK